MDYRCDCEDYKESMPQISSAQVLAWTHKMLYTGKVFVYCPWCGKKMNPTEREKSENKN